MTSEVEPDVSSDNLESDADGSRWTDVSLLDFDIDVADLEMPPATAMRDVEVMADIPLPPPPPIYYRLTADAQDAAVQCDYIEEPPELLPPPVPIGDLAHHTATTMLSRSGLRLDQLRDEVTDSIGRLVGTNSSQDRAISAAVEFGVTMVGYMAQDLLDSTSQHFSHWPDSTPATTLSAVVDQLGQWARHVPHE